MWDVNVNNLVHPDGVTATTESGIQSSLLSLLQKCHAFVIAVRAPPPTDRDGSCGGMSSSAISLRSTVSSRNYDWHWSSLDHCIDMIEKRIDFVRSILSVDHRNKNDNNTTQRHCCLPPITVMLTHAEEIVDRYSPRHWMQLTERMKRYDDVIVEWRLVSGSMDTSSSCQEDGIGSTRGNDAASMASSKGTEAATVTSLTPFLERMQWEQRKMMEEFDYAVEETLVGLIRSFLDKR